MAAPKARNITRVFEENDVWKVEADGRIDFVSALNRTDLLRAAKVRFPDTPGNRWFRVDQAAIVKAITTGIVPAGVSGDDGLAPTPKQVSYANALGKRLGVPVPSFGSRDEASQWIDAAKAQIASIEDKGVNEVIDPPTDSDAAALKALRDLLKVETEVKLDEEQIRSIIREEVESLAPRKIVVEYKGEQREVEGSSHSQFDLVLAVVAADCNVLLVGEAGSGKSTLAFQVAEALGLESRSLSVGPTTPTSKLFGYQDAHGNTIRTPLRDAYEYGYLFLLDEVDNGHPGLLTELNQLLANGHAAFPDGNVKRHENFRLVATANTYGRGGDRLFVGRNQLDAAFLDRFCTIDVNVDDDLETKAALAVVPESAATVTRAWVKRVQKVRAAVSKQKLPIVISPRASIEGAKLLNQGLSEAQVADIRLFAGLSADQRALIEK